MAARQPIVFKHDSALGDAPAHKLFDLTDAKHRNDTKPPRSFGDYVITVGKEPNGVTIEEKI
ncbi:type I-C CRISPR-associated protein Cas7/Csd2 [Desulfonema ishimotonii]|uniref:Type I-C CRISPR-associated protein Cas7/Csd2 n=1 Tax=Desulfonema ishimotonii TaxID=45657 RepID=A0A401FW94_9BACT|nr:type I-C CRISPR-associated protein Cas7/Csd2 [Desulfonema ishimotonii]